MITPTLAGDNRLIGKVYECRVYNRALTAKEIEVMHPNMFSNEFRTKGTAEFLVPNRRYCTYHVSHIYLDMMVDMGEHGTPEFAGQYPKAVGVKIDGVDDVIWLGTGSNGHLKTSFYELNTIKPYRNFKVKMVNTGLCPGLTVKVLNFRCVLLGLEKEVIDSVDAMDFAVEWDKEELTIAAGEVLSGKVSYSPEDANTGTSLTAAVSGDVLTAAFADDMVTVTGVSAGESMLTLTLPSGMTREYLVTVTD